jgi:hypothetical protein
MDIKPGGLVLLKHRQHLRFEFVVERSGLCVDGCGVGFKGRFEL